MNGMVTGALLDGTKVGTKCVTLPQDHDRLEVLDLGGTSSLKWSEWVKMNLDTGAAANTFTLNFGPEGAGDARFYRTASGEWILDSGACQLQGYDENGLLRSLIGRLIGVHNVLCIAAEISCKGRQDFFFGHDGGYMIPIHSKIFQRTRIHDQIIWRMEMRNRIFQENRARDCQEIEELRRISCEERDGARQWRNDELCTQQEKNLSTVSQLLTPIQEIQNKVNSLNDARDSYDPETASSSGASHVSQPTLEYSESQDTALPRFWIAARYTEFHGYLQKLF